MPHLLALVPPPPVSDVLRSLGTFDELGPRITVKAQPGLDDEHRSSWLPRLRRAVFGFGPVTVQLGPVGTFGDDVVFLEVLSDRVHELHRLLVEVVDPPLDEAARHFELDDWHPHLTVPLGPGADADQLRAAVDALGPVPPFTVTALWVCRQDASGRCVRDAPLGLHRRTAA